MVHIEHVYTIAVFQRPHAVDGARSNPVYGTLWADSRAKVHSPHAADIAILIVAEQLGWHATVYPIDIAQTVLWTHELIEPCMDLLAQIAVRVQGVNVKGFPMSPDIKQWLLEHF